MSCFVCDKHRDVDAVLEDEHVVVSHLPLSTPAGTAETAYLGYLIVEPRRHVAELGDLTPEEAAAFGQAAARASAAAGPRRRARLRGDHRPRRRPPAPAPDPALPGDAARVLVDARGRVAGRAARRRARDRRAHTAAAFSSLTAFAPATSASSFA